MRTLAAFVVLSLAFPVAATAGNTTRTDDQSRKAESKPTAAPVPCMIRDRERPVRDPAPRAECRVIRPVPPVIDPTPQFLL